MMSPLLRTFRFCLYLFILILLSVQFGCSEGNVISKQYSCDNSEECKRDKVCQEGQCIKQDNDDDGFAPGKNRDCDDNTASTYPGAPEICDNKTDDNCNGKIDETPCQCIPGKEEACGPKAVGECKRGIQRCDKKGKWGDCKGAVDPSKEECNGKDDNCNGKIDEQLTGECYSGKDGTKGRGNCKAGTRTCKNGKWSKCVGEIIQQVEKCNNQDDDCDAVIDNDLEKSCYGGPKDTAGRGLCKAGKLVCQAGKWSDCKGELKPKPEDCNNQDDDCDGKVDEGLSGVCYNGPASTKNVGACRAGKRSCNGGSWTKCLGEITPAGKESCGDNKDNNCDGQVDEGCGAGLFEIRQTIDTDSGKIDGIVVPGWKGKGRFELQSLKIGASSRIKVTGKNLLSLLVRGRVEILGTIDLSGKDGTSTNCSTSSAGAGGTGGGGGGAKGGTGGACNIRGSQPPAGNGGGNGSGKGGKGAGANAGGGGGGGHASAGINGLPSGAGGKGGLPVGSATTVTSGSGGGGGACGAYGSFPLGIWTPGAGGGGGGGGLQIESSVGDIVISGNIIANGGTGGLGPKCAGGGVPGAAIGGGGGGGSGGTIILRAKKQVIIKASAFLDASGGTGNGQPKSKGGNASAGRIRFQDGDGKVSFPAARIKPAPTLAKY